MHRLAAVFALLVFVVASPATSQTLLAEYTGDQPGARFGDGAVTLLPDADGDGLAESLIGTALFDVPPLSVDAGRAQVRDRDGFVTCELFGESGLQWLGVSVASLGDVDGDGWPECVVGVPLDDGTCCPEAGRALVVSAIDCRVLGALEGISGDENLGLAARVVGDMNGDGKPEIGVGSPNASSAGFGTGRAAVFDGLTFARLSTIDGANLGDRFGSVVLGVGDVTGDGVADLGVTAPFFDDGPTKPDAGALFVYSGAACVSGGPCTPIAVRTGDEAGDTFGTSAVNLGDVTGDGVDDVVVGAPFAQFFGLTDNGAVTLLAPTPGASPTLATVYTNYGIQSGQGFGSYLANVGDLNGDCRAEFAVSSPRFDDGPLVDAGGFSVYEGAFGASTPNLGTVFGDIDGAQLGRGLGSGADFDGDGFFDLIAAAPLADLDGFDSEDGLVRIYSLDPVDAPWSAILATSESTGLAGARGVPKLLVTGDLTPGSTLRFDVCDALSNTPASLCVGTSALIAAFKGGVLCPTPDVIVSTATDALGALDLVATWPDPFASGVDIVVQWWFLEAPGQWSSTVGFEATTP